MFVWQSVVARGLLNGIAEKADYVPQFINFSAQTSSKRTQEMIEGKLEKRRKNVIGAPLGKRVIIFVDDLNMPKLDTYGSQPPIELLRQYQDFGGMYDREKLFWKEIHVRHSSVYFSFVLHTPGACLAEQTLILDKCLSESSQCLRFHVVSKHKC